MKNEFSFLNIGSHGVMVSTLDSESSDPSSNLGGTYFLILWLCLKILLFYFDKKSWFVKKDNFVPLSMP